MNTHQKQKAQLPLNLINPLHHFLKPTLLAFLLSIAALQSHAHNISHFQKAKTDTLQPAKAKTLNTNPNITIVFSRAENTQLGYDQYKEPLLKTKYEKVIDETDKKEIYPAWKALESGKPDYVKVDITASGTYKADSVYFKTEDGLPIAKTGSSLTLIGGTDGSDTRVYATYKTGKDERRLAQINTASYDKITNKLYVVPLNGANVDAGQIQTALNQVYKQAVAEFIVEVKPSFTIPEGIGSIEVGTSGLLSNYTDDMQKIIKAYKAANDNIDKEALYLFIGLPASDASQKGYMPRAKNFGFIFSNDSKTISHELGHGAFHLKHTFDETSVPKGSSQNLMDYTDQGTFLNKYQWDYVHNPAFVIGLFESDKAGAMTQSMNSSLESFQEDNPFGWLLGTTRNKFGFPKETNESIWDLFANKGSIESEVKIELHWRLRQVAGAIWENNGLDNVLRKIENGQIPTWKNGVKALEKVTDTERNTYKANDANKMSAIILHDFATGNGPSQMDFAETDNFAVKLNSNDVLLKDAIGKFYDEMNEKKFTSEESLINSTPYNGNYKRGYAFSPGDASIKESWQKHFEAWNNNPIAFVIGGMSVEIRKSNENFIISFKNKMGLKSLGLHLMKDYDPSYRDPLASIEQTFSFKL